MMQILLIFVLIMLNAIFAASEVALIAANDTKVESDAQLGNKRAKRIESLIKNPTNFLSAIQIGITLIGFLNGYLAADAFSSKFVEFTQRFISVNAVILMPIMTFLVTVILAYFQVVLGELVPKRIAMKYPERIAYGTSGVLVVISTIMRPFVWLLTVSANAIGKLFGIKPNEYDERMTEEEIRMIVSSSGRKGVLDKSESEMIENILDFDDTDVSEIMTHRTEMAAININASKKEILDFVKEEKYTRFPVYKEHLDHIVGVFHVKDLLRFIDNNDEAFDLKKLIRKPFFVPDSKKTNALLNEMKRQQTHLAIVIDEYGGTAGLVTIEDLLEEIVGNIFDEYDEYEEEIEELPDNEFIVDGLTNIDDVEDFIHANLPVDEYDTLSGFILGHLGRFPYENEHVVFEYNQFRFEVINFDDKIIEKVKITQIDNETEDNSKRSQEK
ncbi:MAG: hemolysin family protein [Acholeplasmataceae bacterium]